jgi:hypothetical protein
MRPVRLRPGGVIPTADWRKFYGVVERKHRRATTYTPRQITWLLWGHIGKTQFALTPFATKADAVAAGVKIRDGASPADVAAEYNVRSF